MNLKRHENESPEVNLTPLIDVVFLLLIFFMVSTTFKRDQAIALVLPESTPAPKSLVSPPKLEIIITADAKYLINKREAHRQGEKPKVTRNQLLNPRIKYLKRAIKKLSGGNRQTHIAIRADAKSPHEAFVRVMDALGQLGFKKVSIITQPPKSRD